MATLTSYTTQFVPGGAVGTSPLPNQNPWELMRGMISLAVLSPAVGGIIQNAALNVPGLVGWRSQIDAADAVDSRGLWLFGTVAGVGGRTRIPPMASYFSGAITGFPATKVGHWFIESDVRLTTVTGGAGEIYFVFSPSWARASGVIGASNGFGLVWANTLANDNYHLVVADATGVLLANVDTGIVANDSVLRVLRVEFGNIGGAPTIRALIDSVVVATITGPLALTTANKLGAFNQNYSIGCDKPQADVTNSADAWFGTALGIKFDRIDIP